MAKPKQQTFNIHFDLKVFASVEVSAASFEDALIKAREFTVTDVVNINGEYIDGEIELTGVFK